ncbi:MAG: GNAT family N-acetyltransferase, partial [Acetobacteraceae bacterium]|nr:GNAT family N-acetyltransferase [Acetobacteraceae bacterium]
GLVLGESGSPKLDSPYIEHNGMLGDFSHDPGLLLECLNHSRRAARRLVMSGVDQTHLDLARKAGGVVVVRQVSPAPWLDLAELRARCVGFLDTLSANTRYQVRRSHRFFSHLGPLRLRRAETEAEARSYLASLATLHQASWARRGQPGAFADPFFRRFHENLIHRGFREDVIDLLRITAGSTTVGFLYNFRYRGRVYAYQSGLNYDLDSAHAKPGLTCHTLAIEAYLGEGLLSYDFLAGDDRYKTSLASRCTDLHWVTVEPWWSFRGLMWRFKDRGWVNPIIRKTSDSFTRLPTSSR